MSRKRMLVGTMGLLAAAVLAVGCGSARKESGGDQTGAGGGLARNAVAVGIDKCHDCHADTAVAGVRIFDEWNRSRHSNANQVPPADFFFAPAQFCSPCHDRDKDSLNLAGYVGPGSAVTPRPVAGCEACHGGGSMHWGVGPLPHATPGGFANCSNDKCHALEAYEDHGSSSPYSWVGVDGPLGDQGSYDALSDTLKAAVLYTGHVTINGLNFSVQFVSPKAGPVGSGPYRFEGVETINDTHFNQTWIENEDNKVTKYWSPLAQLGYVDLTNTSPNSGLVRADSDKSCTASCHKPHQFDNTVNRQWGNGAHHLVAQGPLFVNSSGAVKPSVGGGGGPENWDAVNDGFGIECGRCHTANGFAEANPGSPRFGADGRGNVSISGRGQFITCNACHDGQGYPAPEATRLRFTDTIPLYNYAGRTTSIYTIKNAGHSAVCMYCHQAREDNTRIDANIKAFNAATGNKNAQYSSVNQRRSKTLRFRNSHYLASAAVLYGKKGYEFSWATTGVGFGGYGVPYAGSFFPHINPAEMGDTGPCATCHMNDAPASATLGGHTFFNKNSAGEENTALCNAPACHSIKISTFEAISAKGDWDGDGTILSAEGEINALMTTVLGALLRYNGNQGSVILSAHTEAYPYFFIHYHNAYDTTLAKATFNWQFLHKAEGSWAHNWKYSVELLRDSWRSILGAVGDGIGGALGPIPIGDDPRGAVASSP